MGEMYAVEEEKISYVVEEQEKELGSEVAEIELMANAFTIATDNDFATAGETVRKVKAAKKKVDEYWEPMRATAYSAYQTVLGHKKKMSEPLDRAEKILKKKMAEYQTNKERKHREEEERLKAMAEAELKRKLAEAQEAEKKGDMFGADYAKTEAEALEAMKDTLHVEAATQKLDGISQSKGWEITRIDLSKLPTDFMGVLIRPADEKAIMRIIKSSKGKVEIPGVSYKETVKFSVSA